MSDRKGTESYRFTFILPSTPIMLNIPSYNDVCLLPGVFNFSTRQRVNDQYSKDDGHNCRTSFRLPCGKRGSIF